MFSNNMGDYRGEFLEILSFKLISKNFNNEKLFRESKLSINNFYSHTWDIIVELDEYYNCYECKFSSFSLKRNQLDKILTLKQKTENVSVYLVILQTLSIINQRLYNLQEDTGDEDYIEFLSEINIISIEDFLEGNPFKID